MITIVRSKTGEIKTYSAGENMDYSTALGETIEQLDTTIAEYATRFKLSAKGRSGETVRAAMNSGVLKVRVSCPGQSEVDVDVNGLVEQISLENGENEILLSTENAGIYVITPADRRKYCAAGEGLLTVEVM